MSKLMFVTHPEVVVDPDKAIDRWHLSAAGIARMRIFAGSPIVADVAAVWASRETKTIEAAGILAGTLGCGIHVCAGLNENDRRSTGFLPPAEFECVADQFFEQPTVSIRGWERAVDAQKRVHQAVMEIAAEHVGGDLAIIAHGAVGTLLYCALSGNPISRKFDQPFQGQFWTATLPDLKPGDVWQPIAPKC